MAAIVLIFILISIASVASRPISILFGSMISCHFADISNYVWDVQSDHSICMTVIVLIVLLITIATIVSRPISTLFRSMVA